METLTNEEQAIHRKYAVDLFNFVWKLLEKTERSVEEEDEMIHAAHASRYHWGKAGTAVNLARGEWQISRVYSTIKHPEAALHHARRCLAICQENGIGDFDLAYAYEALARAAAVAGYGSSSRHYTRLAWEAARQIQEEDDRQLFENDMKTIPVDVLANMDGRTA